MPRIARVVATGYPHHVTQRGNYGHAVFERDRDFLQYLEWLKEYSDRYSLEIWAYCLMNNHVHFVCVPGTEEALSGTFQALHMRYSRFLNERKQASGHLWQGRFYSTMLDEAHLYAAVRYVENNPLRAGIVRKAEDYRWSSARAHIEGTQGGIISAGCYLLKEIRDWRSYLREKEDGELIEHIRKYTVTGRPCGDDSFISKLERKFGRRLRALPHGRPKKINNSRI